MLHCLFVHGMMHTTIRVNLKDDFMKKYFKDFPITGGRLIKSCLGMQVEQGYKKIKLHPDHCVWETLQSVRCPPSRGLPNHSLSAQAEVLPVICGQASVRCDVDSL